MLATPLKHTIHRCQRPTKLLPPDLRLAQAASSSVDSMQRAQSLVQSLRVGVSAFLQHEAAPASRWLSTAATEAASSAPEGVSILPRHQALKRALKPQASLLAAAAAACRRLGLAVAAG